ncbi:MAG TPA: tRNA-binding protein [Gemmatimonadales bacterium]|nr:tRNA-binding protein [Gemmatimonadales bacterium]
MTDPVEAFGALDVRVGRVIEATVNAKARKPAYVLRIDFGPLGVRTSSAQLTVHYTPAELVGRQVVAAMNLGTRNVAGVVSEVLVLGLPDADGAVVLREPEREVPLGGRMY